MPLIDTGDVEACALLGNLADAVRAHAIFLTREARVRPAEAWICLPIGLSAGDAVVHLSTLPEAPDDEFYVQHRELLRVRLATARTAWHMHQLGRTRAPVTN